MKLFAYLAALATTNALECWSCAGKSHQKCLDNGHYETCLDNQEVCQVHQRKRDGFVYRVRMGCKQHRACNNNMKNNWFVDAATTHDSDQCRPNSGMGEVSVCRQCCDRDRDCGLTLTEANAGDGPLRAGWDEDLADHVLPPNSGKNRKNKFKNLAPGDHDPNDSRYAGPLTDYVKDPNDSRYDPADPRHGDVDYSGPPEPSSLGWSG